jgi:hypothetical protein
VKNRFFSAAILGLRVCTPPGPGSAWALLLLRAAQEDSRFFLLGLCARRICGRCRFSVRVSHPRSGLATFGSVCLFLHATASVLAISLPPGSSCTNFCYTLIQLTEGKTINRTDHHCSRGCPPLPHLLFLINLQGSDFRADFCLACLS